MFLRIKYTLYLQLEMIPLKYVSNISPFIYIFISTVLSLVSKLYHLFTYIDKNTV